MQSSTPLRRYLSAIAFADVANFSRLIATDESEALRQWKAIRTEAIEPCTIQHGGRIAETAGDAVLVEFPSTINALQWAIDVQRAVESRRGEINAQTMQLRIGINVDDVVLDDGVIHGDGVNIAARIHQAAEPGQIVVTARVRDYVSNRLPVAFHDLGAPRLKNINRPVHVYAVRWTETEGVPASHPPYLQWSTRPTVAVLPFRTLGGVEGDSYFGDGITEDIITGLSRSRAFYVIARTSTLRYRDRTKDLRQIASELDVRYVFDGSVRRWGKRLRITAELIDVASNRPIWAERYDGVGIEIFEFLDRIVDSIVASIEPRLQAAEIDHVKGRPTDSLDAYHCILKAMSRLYAFTDDSYRETDVLLRRAIALDPTYAQAFAYTAWRLNFWLGEGRSTNFSEEKDHALEAARRAVELDPEDPFALTVLAHLTAFLGRDVDGAMELFDVALKLNENSAFGWALSALTCAYRGHPDEALDRLRNVWRLSPYDPASFYFWIVAGIAEFVAGRYVEATVWLRKSRRANPRFIAGTRMLAACLALAGDKDGAQAVAQDLMQIEPSFRISAFVAWYPLQRPGDLKRLEMALRKAGLPV